MRKSDFICQAFRAAGGGHLQVSGEGEVSLETITCSLMLLVELSYKDIYLDLTIEGFTRF